MIDALKKELAEAFTDEDYVASLTDVLSAQLIKSLKKAAKTEIDELRRKILKHKREFAIGGIVAVMILLKIKRGK